MPILEQIKLAQLTLIPVDQDTSPLFFSEAQKPELFDELGFKAMPTRPKLEQFLKDGRLQVWLVKKAQNNADVGFAGFVGYDGPPYVFFYLQEFNVDLIQETIVGLACYYFKTTTEPTLFLFLPVDDANEHEDIISEAGFDRLDELPTMTNSEETAFVMERATYLSYYSGDEN